MSIEVEQKFCISDSNAVLTALTELGATSKQVVRQVDTYYAHPQRDFATTDEALRIRRVGESNFITYKGPKLDTTTKTRREIELPLAAGELAAGRYHELLDALSFTKVAAVAKIRQIYQLQRGSRAIEIALDQVEHVGDFVELEIVVSDQADIDAAKDELAQLANELSLSGAERRSYLELLLDA